MLFELYKQNVFVTSDSHFGHNNICKNTTAWNLDEITPGHAGVRDFDTLEKMNQCIVDNINNNVKENDILIHLGDWSFGGIDNIWEFRKKINCKNIYLCYGNHDHHIKGNKVLPNCGQLNGLFYNSMIYYDKLNIDKPESAIVTAKDLFTYTDHVLDFKVKFTKQGKAERFFCSHYSHRVWDQHHKGVFHLYGHSHSSLEHEPNGRSIDVGIDNAYKLLGEYRPFNITEVYEVLKDRSSQIVDHHIKGVH
jgi:calcineurin-like phosphoesterase family protein